MRQPALFADLANDFMGGGNVADGPWKIALGGLSRGRRFITP
jgi:hypothetical protein